MKVYASFHNSNEHGLKVPSKCYCGSSSNLDFCDGNIGENSFKEEKK